MLNRHQPPRGGSDLFMNPADTQTTLQGYLSDMQLIRCFEQRVEQLFSEGRIGGTAHPATGQEAVAVGVAAARQPGDPVTSTHRGHAHFLACGANPDRVMAELFGRRTGYAGGRGGSQMMADYRAGFIGANGITGGSIPIATGLALNATLSGKDRVALCFFGDGASNQGTFHESLNLAALWKLPVLFLCENNGYAMSTAIQDGVSNPAIASRAEAYGMTGLCVDGNDVMAVRAAVTQARAAAAAGDGPALLELKTYRLSGHSRGDQRAYRSDAEEQHAWAHEPINRFETYLMKKNLLTRERAESIRNEAAERIEQAITKAEAAPLPGEASAAEGVYA